MIDWEIVIGAALASVPAVNLLVAVIKTAVARKTTVARLEARYYPTLAVLCGMVINVWLAWLSGASDPKAFGLAVTVGFVAGGLSCKIFEYGKTQETTSEFLDQRG